MISIGSREFDEAAYLLYTPCAVDVLQRLFDGTQPQRDTCDANATDLAAAVQCLTTLRLANGEAGSLTMTRRGAAVAKALRRHDERFPTTQPTDPVGPVAA